MNTSDTARGCNNPSAMATSRESYDIGPAEALAALTLAKSRSMASSPDLDLHVTKIKEALAGLSPAKQRSKAPSPTLHVTKTKAKYGSTLSKAPSSDLDLSLHIPNMKDKYSSRITFLSSTIQDFATLRNKLSKLPRPIRSGAMNTIIDEFQPLIAKPVKSELIDFLWEEKMRLDATLAGMLKDLAKFGKTVESKEYKDDGRYQLAQRKKIRDSLKNSMVPLEHILHRYAAKKPK